MNIEPGSRAATNDLLTGLRDGRWRPRAWARFLGRAAARSLRQARRRPRALAEITVLHALYACAGHRNLGWTAASWALAATHLGMLEDRASIGVATAVTLTRANLPTVTDTRWLPVLALATDLADGRLARARRTVTPFGRTADSLADAAFWTWFAFRHEPSRRLRTVALLAWVAPATAVAATSFRRGRMVDPPAPVLLRPAATMQVVLTVRALVRQGVTAESPTA